MLISVDYTLFLMYSQQMNIIYRAHAKYDTIKEPGRFLLMLCLVIPAITLINMESIIASICGVLWLGFLIVPRMLYIGKKHG